MPLQISKANQKDLLDIAAEATASEGFMRDAVAFAARFDTEEDLRAVAVFQNFSGQDAEAHFAVLRGRISRKMMETFLTLSFHPRMLGLRRIFAPIPESNVSAQRAALAAGFKFEYRKRAFTEGGEDAIVFSISPKFSE